MAAAQVVRVGVRFRILWNGAYHIHYKIVPWWQAYPAFGRISSNSNLARAVLGKKTGDAVEIDGNTAEIVSIG